MVKLDTVYSINRELVQSQPLVAVFTGGTGGIGPMALKALAATVARHRGQGLRAYLIGRNAGAAEKLMSECRDIYGEGEYHYIKTDDLSLVEQVDTVCADLRGAETRNAASAGQTARIDYLFLSHGGPIFLPRQDTKEGLDRTMACLYYSRMAFVTSLMPLLLASPLPAAVVSVFAAGMEAKLYVDDLSLRAPSHYSYAQARSHVVYMHTCFFEELARRHPGRLRLIHVFPGTVLHEGVHNPANPWWVRLLFGWIIPLLGLNLDPDECGQRMVSLASPSYYPAAQPQDASNGIGSCAIAGTDERVGHGGAYAVTWSGESVYPKRKYEALDKDELRTRVWDHTNAALDVIRSGRVFQD
ncbi:hypothetical protein VTK73DRAFT_968 [Phialemonium thermophilum]|uniref:NAD(P)-dependent dehydrogenase, short-chain alcohol dehydrogenase family n=1 Tax=Phialemonium thermophilum TaxID=223376 RepID=A0ABR3VU46_9PEZI